MIAGGYFYVNGTEKSEKFFKEIGEKLLNYYVTDNNLMGKQCIENFAGNKCGKFPYSKIVNWRWKRPESLDSSDLPILFQFDGGDGAESKLQAMKRLGAAFLDFDTLDPNIPTPIKCFNKPMKAGILTETRYFESTETQKANLIIQFFHAFFEFLNSTIPGLEYLILSKIFPFWAYYLII
uniref:Nucleotide-diphospho-sugar transferase domain-containing protein n=2 Tax=Panagrolaimus sp. PS1159 TaxID=55785 RepID=A0AC35GAS7_9BILA